MPYFSVVLPTYNRARMAAAAVLSVLGQSERDFELIVVDDGSTDDTAAILAKLPKDERLRVLSMEKNQGQHKCRNRAIREARGEFVTFLDSDDLYLPERLAEFRRAAESRPGTGFWFSNAYQRRYGRIIGRLFEPGRGIPEGKVPGWYAVGDEFLPYVTTNVAIRRQAFDRYGFYREDLKILEDTELYARMLGGGLEVGAISTPLSVRALHEGQITGDYQRDFTESLLALEAGKPPKEEAERKRRELAIEIATYLWKGLQPEEARELLKKELGEDAASHPLYRRTFLPGWLLSSAKKLRELGLRLRYSEFLAPPDYRRAARLIRPYLDHAARL